MVIGATRITLAGPGAGKQVTYKPRRKGHDTGVGHEHIKEGLLRQNLVCGFLDGGKVCVVAANPFQLGGTTGARLDAVDGLLSRGLVAAGDVDLGWVAARQHLSCGGSEAIGTCSPRSVRATLEATEYLVYPALGMLTTGDQQHLAVQLGHIPLEVEVELDHFGGRGSSNSRY